MKRKKIGRKATKWRKEVEKLREKFSRHLGTAEGTRILKKLEKANNAYFRALPYVKGE